MITLKTLPDATEQEVFDQVATSLLRQGVKSLRSIRDVGEECCYRSIVDGKQLVCAAGSLIAQDEYDEEFETRSWIALVNDDKVPSAHLDLIGRLQNIHDAHKPKDWQGKLEIFASRRQLEFRLENYLGE